MLRTACYVLRVVRCLLRIAKYVCTSLRSTLNLSIASFDRKVPRDRSRSHDRREPRDHLAIARDRRLSPRDRRDPRDHGNVWSRQLLFLKALNCFNFVRAA